MFTSGGQAARSKYCRRQGSASQIGIEVQFDWNIVFIVQTRQGAQRRALGAPCRRSSSMPRKTRGHVKLCPPLRKRASAVLERQRMDGKVCAGVGPCGGGSPSRSARQG